MADTKTSGLPVATTLAQTAQFHLNNAGTSEAASVEFLFPFRNIELDGAVPDGVTDNLAAIHTSLALFATDGGTVVAGEGTFSLGSTGTLNIPQSVSFIGQGPKATIFTSTFDGHIIRTDYQGAPYNNKGVNIGGFQIVGDVTKTSQDGMSFLRFSQPSSAFDIDVNTCGRHGISVYECVGGEFRSLVSQGNVGRGLYIDEGFAFWTDFEVTSNTLPTNACTFINFKADLNDEAGIYITNSNGNTFYGGYTQGSYAAFGNNVGYNVYFADGAFGNSFHGFWVEGGVKAHIYTSGATSNPNEANKFYNLYHVASGGRMDRAVIADRGCVEIHGHSHTGDNYVTTVRNGNSVSTPFRCCTADTLAWAGTTPYIIGDLRVNDGINRYICTVAGTSAASGGPTGQVIDPTSRDLTDGTATWIYDGIEHVGRIAFIGSSAGTILNGTNYKVIENQLSEEPTALYASEVLFWNSAKPQP